MNSQEIVRDVYEAACEMRRRMNPQERIIRNAYEAACNGSCSFGAGGRAVAHIYDENPIEVVNLLGMIAIMANGLAELESRFAGQPSVTVTET